MFSRFFKKSSSEKVSADRVDEQSQPNDALGSLSAEKLKSVIVSLNTAEPIFLKAGYLMQQLDVEFGNQPKLTPHFRQQKVIEETLQNEILEQLADQQLIRFILISLFKSARMQSLFENSELYYYGMEIDISAVPSVRTLFRRKESIAEVIPFNS